MGALAHFEKRNFQSMKCIHVVCRMLVFLYRFFFWYFRNKNYEKKHVNTKIYNIECFRICTEVTNILCFSAFWSRYVYVCIFWAFNVWECSFPYWKHFNTQKCCFMLLYFSPFTTNKTVCFIQEDSIKREVSQFYFSFSLNLFFLHLSG